MLWNNDGWKLKPETAEEVREVETIQGKRARLNRFAYRGGNPLVRAIFDSAEYRGLSGEDKMTWLAYEALLRVEQLEALIIDDIALRPSSSFVIDKTA